MKDFYIKGKITAIIPVSVYENKVYTQDIILELEDGIQIEIDDSVKKIRNDEIGEVKCIQVRTFTVQPIIKNKKNEVAIISHGKHMGPHADIHGYIEKIIKEKPEYSVVLDVGTGKIILNTDEKQINGFSEKDYIILKGAWLGLGEIKDAK